MSLGEEESAQRRGFEESLRHADVSMEELWLRYFTLGGLAGQFEVEAYIHGAMSLPALQRDVLAHALNERLDEMLSAAPRAPYSRAPSSRGDEDDEAGGDTDDGGTDGGGQPGGGSGEG
jgi:hypothetical protein